MKLSDIISESRSKRALSIYSLARESGLSRAYIMKLEKGESTPTLDSLRKLSKPLGYSLLELVELIEGKKNIYKTNIEEVEERVSKDRSFFSYPLSSRSADRKQEFFSFRFQKRGEHLAVRPQGAIISLFVLKGEMIFEVDQERIVAKNGDYIQINISKNYRFIQSSSRLAEGIIVIRYT